MILQIGMHVIIKDDKRNYGINAGTKKKVTSHLKPFGYNKKLAYGLDDDSGIWLAEDFSKCVEYPHKSLDEFDN